jgi:hypothetical protein
MGNHRVGRLAAVVVLGLLSFAGAGCSTIGTMIAEAPYLNSKQTPSSGIKSKGDSAIPSRPARTHRR